MGYQKQEFKDDGADFMWNHESFSGDYTDDYADVSDDSYSDDEE